MTKQVRLATTLSLEKAAHSEAKKVETELHRKAGARALFDGFFKRYVKKDEADGEDLPSQAVKVQATVSELLESTQTALSPVFDLILTKDSGNCQAKGTVTVEGLNLTDVPVTTLLFLEKELTDLRTFVSGLPVLDSADTWALDTGSSLWKTEPVETFRTKKVSKPVVLYPATDKHPAQTQLVQEDVVVGTYQQEKHSGAIPESRKKVLLDRVSKLLAAVKTAREEANSIKVDERKMGEAVFTYLFS